jgi:hypothetical protein
MHQARQARRTYTLAADAGASGSGGQGVILFETEGLVAFVLFLFWVWALFDCISTDSSLCRNLPKGMWLILVLLLPDIGALAWLLLGRPQKAGWRPGSTDYASPRRAIGPEDRPQYSVTPEITERRSKELDSRLDEWELNKREAELRRRELEVRERELQQRERDLDKE